MSSNGRLPSSQLKAIPGGRLRNDAAWSWLRLRARIAKETRGGVWICPTSTRTAYRTFAEQEFFWRNQPPLAARPGTSNHGWGIAVDVPTVQMAQLINKYGASYGWQKRWSDAQSEWWHFKYAEEHDKHKGEHPGKKPDAEYLTKNEASARRRLLRQRNIAKRNGGWDQIDPSHLKKAKKAKDDIRAHRRKIKAAAKRGGWKGHRRRERYRSLGRALNG